MGFGDVYFSLRHTQIGRPEKPFLKKREGAEIYGKSKEKDDKPTWMWGSHFLFQVDMQRYTPSNGGVSKR